MKQVALNGFKKYDRIFKFMPGDAITYNGAVMMYYPSQNNHDSRRKIPQGIGPWSRRKGVEIPYQIKNQLKRFVDKNRGENPFTNMTLHQYDRGEKIHNDYYKWIIESVDENDPLFDPVVKEKDTVFEVLLTEDKLTVSEKDVEKRTDKQIILKRGHDAFYKNRWLESEMNKVFIDDILRRNPLALKYMAVCDIDNLDKIKDEMVEKMERAIQGLIDRAESIRESFAKVKEEQGY